MAVDDAIDVVTGVAAIAAVLGEKSPERVARLAREGRLPVWKSGGLWQSTRTALQRQIDARAAEALARCGVTAPAERP